MWLKPCPLTCSDMCWIYSAFEFLAVKWGDNVQIIQLHKFTQPTAQHTCILCMYTLMNMDDLIDGLTEVKALFLSQPLSIIEFPQTTFPSMTEHFHYLLFITFYLWRISHDYKSPPLSSPNSSHAHAQAKILLSFLGQLHMRCNHCLHPLVVEARKCFPISFMCHCSFPSSAGCLLQLVNWFIMLSSPE